MEIAEGKGLNPYFEGQFDGESDELRALRLTLVRERDEALDVLRRNGFVLCDIAACNCGSWHARYGIPERMAEIKDALTEAGHPMTNENGHLPIKALAELVKERDEARAEVERLRSVLLGHMPRVYARNCRKGVGG